MSSSVTDISSARNGLRSPERFLNRELSWLDFNLRVLETASSERVPLLERVRFLSIAASNLDEFYMVRVAGLVGQVMAGVADRSADGLTPALQLDAIRDKVRSLLDRQHACERKLLSLCRDAGISITAPGSLGRAGREWLSSWFETQLFPVLSPLAIDPAHPFPFIRNGSLVYAVQLSRGEDGKRMKGLILVPPQVERFIRIPGPKTRFVPLEKVMDCHMDSLFPGFDVEAHGIFQITRDSLLEIDEEADDLVRTFETALKRRRGGYVTRVDMDADMPEELAGFITNELRASPSLHGFRGSDAHTAGHEAREAGRQAHASHVRSDAASGDGGTASPGARQGSGVRARDDGGSGAGRGGEVRVGFRLDLASKLKTYNAQIDFIQRV